MSIETSTSTGAKVTTSTTNAASLIVNSSSRIGASLPLNNLSNGQIVNGQKANFTGSSHSPNNHPTNNAVNLNSREQLMTNTNSATNSNNTGTTVASPTKFEEFKDVIIVYLFPFKFILKKSQLLRLNYQSLDLNFN